MTGGIRLETPLVELMARGTVLYFGILLFIRIMPGGREASWQS
ncbi:MAG: hypothetical protein ABJA94_11695 [Rhodoglobus sp.]